MLWLVDSMFRLARALDGAGRYEDAEGVERIAQTMTPAFGQETPQQRKRRLYTEQYNKAYAEYQRNPYRTYPDGRRVPLKFEDWKRTFDASFEQGMQNEFRNQQQSRLQATKTYRVQDKQGNLYHLPAEGTTPQALTQMGWRVLGEQTGEEPSSNVAMSPEDMQRSQQFFSKVRRPDGTVNIGRMTGFYSTGPKGGARPAQQPQATTPEQNQQLFQQYMSQQVYLRESWPEFVARSGGQQGFRLPANQATTWDDYVEMWDQYRGQQPPSMPTRTPYNQQVVR